MGVRIDTAGHDVAAARIQGLGAGGHIQALTDSDNLIAFGNHVRAHRLVRGDDRAALDMNRHDHLLFF